VASTFSHDARTYPDEAFLSQMGFINFADLRLWLLLTPRIQDYEAHDKTQTEIWLRHFANDIVEQT
jgi:hypothetical protein